MKRAVILASVLTIGLPGLAVAQIADTNNTQPPAEEAPATAETSEETAYLDEQVCRRQDRVASRLPSRTRICMSRRAWRQMEEEQQEFARDMGRGNHVQAPEAQGTPR